jgi:hypothetical protein
LRQLSQSHSREGEIVHGLTIFFITESGELENANYQDEENNLLLFWFPHQHEN